MRRRRRSIVLGITVALLGAGLALPAEAALPLQKKKCGQVVKTSFRLKNNLNCEKSGLKIGANGITINLNGKTIRGDGGEDDRGIDNADGFDRVVITGPADGSSLIVGFHDGIKGGSGAVRMTIKNVTLLQNAADGIDLDGGSFHAVVNVSIRKSGESGIESDGMDLRLNDVEILRSGLYGVDSEGARPRLTAVRSMLNKESGAFLQGDEAKITGGKFSGNKRAGLVVFGWEAVVASAEALDNTAHGFLLTGNGISVTGVRARTNGSETADPDSVGGMMIWGDGNTVRDSVFRANVGYGLHVLGTQATIIGNKICGNAGGELADEGSGTILDENEVAFTCP